MRTPDQRKLEWAEGFLQNVTSDEVAHRPPSHGLVLNREQTRDEGRLDTPENLANEITEVSLQIPEKNLHCASLWTGHLEEELCSLSPCHDHRSQHLQKMETECHPGGPVFIHVHQKATSCPEGTMVRPRPPQSVTQGPAPPGSPRGLCRRRQQMSHTSIRPIYPEAFEPQAATRTKGRAHFFIPDAFAPRETATTSSHTTGRNRHHSGGDRNGSSGFPEWRRGQQTTAMEKLDDFSQTPETASAPHELPYPHYGNIVVLIEQLRMECKDPSSLLKIQEAIQSYERLTQLKSRHCKLLKEKFKKMENKINRIQQKLSDTEHEKGKQKQELCNLRFALKQEEEKRKLSIWLSEKNKEELKKTEEQYNKEVKRKEQLDIRVQALAMELKTVRQNLNQTVEECNNTKRQLSREQNGRVIREENLAKHLRQNKELEAAWEKTWSQLKETWDQHTKAEQWAEKIRDCTQKLEHENCKLKVTVKRQKERIKFLEETRLSVNLNKDVAEKLESASSKCQHLHKENCFLQQKLSSMKITKRKCEKLEAHKRKLEQQIASLKSHMESNMVECGQAEWYKWEIEKRTTQDLMEKMKQVNLILETEEAHQAQLAQLRNEQDTSMRNQMEVRISNLGSELCKMKSQIDANEIAIENYKQLYLEEVKLRRLLSNKLSKMDKRLEETKTKLLEEQQNRSSQHSILITSTVLEPTCIGDLSRFLMPRSLSKESLVITTSDP